MSLSGGLLPDAHAIQHNKEPDKLEKDKHNPTQHNCDWDKKDALMDAADDASGT